MAHLEPNRPPYDSWVWKHEEELAQEFIKEQGYERNALRDPLVYAKFEAWLVTKWEAVDYGE